MSNDYAERVSPTMMYYIKPDNSYDDIQGKEIVKFFFYGCALVLVSDVPANLGVLFHASRFSLFLLLLVSAFIVNKKPTVSILLMTMLLMAGRDFSVADEFNEITHSSASLWELRFGAIRPSWIIFSILLIHVLQCFRFQKDEENKISPHIRRVIVWCSTVPFVTSIIYGGFGTNFPVAQFVTDIKFPLMLIATTVIFYHHYQKNSGFLITTLAAFVGVILARHFVDLIYLVFDFGSLLGEGVNRVSIDSAKGCIIFLVFWGFCMIWTRTNRQFGVILSILSLILLITYGSRLLWVTFFLGSVILLSICGRQRISILITIAILSLIGGLALSAYRPETAALALVRAKTITHGRAKESFSVKVEDNLISRIDPTRYAEMLNIFDISMQRFSFFWGNGYGSFYEESVVEFPIELEDTGSAFPSYSLETGKYYFAHSYLLHVFLKYGFGGLIVISALWLRPGFRLYKEFKYHIPIFEIDHSRILYATMLCLTVFLPTAILQLYWSGKGLFINGVIIASCLTFVERYTLSAR